MSPLPQAMPASSLAGYAAFSTQDTLAGVAQASFSEQAVVKIGLFGVAAVLQPFQCRPDC
jgi:hypothetical protein